MLDTAATNSRDPQRFPRSLTPSLSLDQLEAEQPLKEMILVQDGQAYLSRLHTSETPIPVYNFRSFNGSTNFPMLSKFWSPKPQGGLVYLERCEGDALPGFQKAPVKLSRTEERERVELFKEKALVVVLTAGTVAFAALFVTLSVLAVKS